MTEGVGPPRPWTLFAKHLAGAGQRLLCLPFAGGGATAFRPWVQVLARAGIEVWPVQLPGRENRIGEPAIVDMNALVADLVRQFGPHLSCLPYAVFGHSMGAVVGYEFVREVRRQGLPEPAHLIISGRRPPHRPGPEPPAHALPRAELVAAIRGLGGAGEELLANEAVVDLVLPTLRADLELAECWAWTPAQPLSCPVTVLAGESDSTAPAAELAAWSELCCGPFRLRTLPGGHFYQRAEPGLVITAVRETLAVPGTALRPAPPPLPDNGDPHSLGVASDLRSYGPQKDHAPTMKD